MAHGKREAGLQPSLEGFPKEKETLDFLAPEMGQAKTLEQSQAETETNRQTREGTESESRGGGENRAEVGGNRKNSHYRFL